MLYRVKLPGGTKVGNKFVVFDHWVSIKAKSEWEAKSKATHKLAYQLQHEEPVFIFSNLTLKNIKADISIGDLEVWIHSN